MEDDGGGRRRKKNRKRHPAAASPAPNQLLRTAKLAANAKLTASSPKKEGVRERTGEDEGSEELRKWVERAKKEHAQLRREQQLKTEEDNKLLWSQNIHVNGKDKL